MTRRRNRSGARSSREPKGCTCSQCLYLRPSRTGLSAPRRIVQFIKNAEAEGRDLYSYEQREIKQLAAKLDERQLTTVRAELGELERTTQRAS